MLPDFRFCDGFCICTKHDNGNLHLGNHWHGLQRHFVAKAAGISPPFAETQKLLSAMQEAVLLNPKTSASLHCWSRCLATSNLFKSRDWPYQQHSAYAAHSQAGCSNQKRLGRQGSCFRQSITARGPGHRLSPSLDLIVKWNGRLAAATWSLVDQGGQQTSRRYAEHFGT